MKPADFIKLEKYDPGKNLPSFSVSILPDCNVLHEGTYKFDTKPRSKISNEELDRLIDEFIDIYFFALEDKYISSSIHSEPRTVITVKWQNKNKRVEFDSKAVPPKLIGFQHLIEEVISL